MRQKCIVLTPDFQFQKELEKYWDHYSNPNRKLNSIHLGGSFHQEMMIERGRERIIGMPLTIGETRDPLKQNKESEFIYVDGARIKDILVWPELEGAVFVSERDGFRCGVESPMDYVKSFSTDTVLVVTDVVLVKAKETH